MKIIINRQSEFGTLNGVITKNCELQSLVTKGLKNGTARKIIDNEQTLMYKIEPYNWINNESKR